MKTFEARLAELQQDRDAKALRGKELIDGCGGEYDKLEDAERKEYDDILEAVEGLDSEITRVRRTMKMIDGAVEVPNDAGRDPEAGRKARGHIQMGKGPDVPKGMGFTRYAIAMAVGKGSVSDAIQCAKDRWPNHPEVQTLIKANVGTTASGNWAENLATPQVLASEFIELVRPATILGRVANLRNVPFNRKVQVVTGGSTVAWVGQAAAKPVGEMTFDMITIPRTKVAGIIVLSDELIADATPDAEATVQQDLIAQTAQFLDEQAFDPAITVTSGIRPASLTNGAPVVPASGATAAALRTDLQALLANFSDVGLATGVFVMGSTAALAMSMMLNALGQPAFPGMNIGGGTLLGLPVIVSDNIPGDSTGTLIVLMKANEVFIAQDPAVRLDASREATLDLAGGNTPTFNLWQKNCVAIRAERAIHWLKRRSNAVAYISGASYSG